MEWTLLSSRQNPSVKLAFSLHEKKKREETGLFVAEGLTLFFDFAAIGLYPEAVFLSTDAERERERIEKALAPSPETVCYSLLPFVFEKITSEKGSQGIVSVYRRDRFEKALPLCRFEKLIALENVQDPGNLGTVLRTALALGFDGVLLVGGADPFGTKAVRASMGAISRIPRLSFASVHELFSFLREKGVHSVAACLGKDAVSIENATLSSPVCILIGNEGKGLSREAVEGADQRAIIPIQGAESLNAAVAAAIFLWETARRNG